MAITILLQVEVEPAAVVAYIEDLREKFVDTRQFEGCLGISAYREKAGGGRLVMWERWESRGHYDKYIAWRRATGALDNAASSRRVIAFQELEEVA